MVVYGAATETSIGDLFIAGVVPGLMLTAMLMLAVAFLARRLDLPRQPRADWRTVLKTGRDAIWGLLLIVIILGGIYSGVFTPTEAAAVSAVYAFLIAVFVYRDVRLRDVPQGRRRRGQDHGHADVHHRQRVPVRVRADDGAGAADDVAVDHGARPAAVGLPDRAEPAAARRGQLHGSDVGRADLRADHVPDRDVALGIDPIHLGIIMTVNMEIGMITPPVGLNLFVTSGISQLPVTKVIRAALPWLVVLLAALIIVTYVPWVSLVLPRALD